MEKTRTFGAIHLILKSACREARRLFSFVSYPTCIFRYFFLHSFLQNYCAEGKRGDGYGFFAETYPATYRFPGFFKNAYLHFLHLPTFMYNIKYQYFTSPKIVGKVWKTFLHLPTFSALFIRAYLHYYIFRFLSDCFSGCSLCSICRSEKRHYSETAFWCGIFHFFHNFNSINNFYPIILFTRQLP